MGDPYQNTVAFYDSEDGAEMWTAREEKNSEQRNIRTYQPLDAWNMQGWRVLDVGCGYGRDVAEFRRRGAEAYGCDASNALLAKAEQRVGPYFARYDLRSGDELPFGGSFDMVWCCAVLVHIPRAELAAVLGRMWEALKAGGRLVIFSKSGEGEKLVTNLGEGQDRIMVYYTVKEIGDVLVGLGAVLETANDMHSQSAFGENMFLVCAIKSE